MHSQENCSLLFSFNVRNKVLRTEVCSFSFHAMSKEKWSGVQNKKKKKTNKKRSLSAAVPPPQKRNGINAKIDSLSTRDENS